MRALALCLGLVIAGCSPVVGSACRAPFVPCGRYCVDLQSDGLNCGVCGMSCALGCSAGRCIGVDAAVVLDGGRDGGPIRFDSGVDGGTDGGAQIDAFSPVDANVDASLDAGPLRCGLGTRLCGAVCVDPRDALHCGDCATSCSGTDVCASGSCAADCGALSACGTRCVDTTSDPHHCGDCTTDCGARNCVASTCVAAPDGHVVFVGHDYETRRIEMSQVLANAVFLAGRASTRVLGYRIDATAASVTGTDGALAEAAGARGYTVSVAPSADVVTSSLADFDTFLVYAEANATDATLRALGSEWHDALAELLARGGVIVVCDAPSLMNAGTNQILQTAGLFVPATSSEIVNPRLIAAVGHESDPVIAGVPFPYNGERHTVRLQTLDTGAVVTTGSAPVVFHHVIDN